MFFSISFGISCIIHKMNKKNKMGRLVIKNLTEQYNVMRVGMIRNIYSSNKIEKITIDSKNTKEDKKSFVIKFNGGVQAKEVTSLRKEVTAILSVAQQNDEVILVLESAGGTVNGYGLAASELERIRSQGMNLTVLIDKVAASGGYMMAVIANRIIASPFAIIGSIGVLTETVNFHELLEKKGIKYEQITSGQYKKTVSMFAKNTEEGRKKMQESLLQIHESFKKLIQSKRPHVNITKISTGEFWLAMKAQELGLVDQIMTSTNYLTTIYQNNNQVYFIRYEMDTALIKNIITSMDMLYNKLRNCNTLTLLFTP